MKNLSIIYFYYTSGHVFSQLNYYEVSVIRKINDHLFDNIFRVKHKVELRRRILRYGSRRGNGQI